MELEQIAELIDRVSASEFLPGTKRYAFKPKKEAAS